MPARDPGSGRLGSEMGQPEFSVVLDFTRAETAADPYAFRMGRQCYILRGEGGGAETALLDWDRGLLSDLEAVTQPGCDAATVQRLGNRLRGFLMQTGWSGHERELASRLERGQKILITLRSNAAELYALPWELLPLGDSGRLLGEIPEALVRYAWPDTRTQPETEAARQEGGRIVMAWAGAVPAAAHAMAIEHAARRGRYGFDAQRDVLPTVTKERLLAALADAKAPPISVLHLLCHGARRGETFGLILDGENGSEEVLDAAWLRRNLAPHAGTVRLVVLCACDSGNTGELGNHLGSVAQALHQAGFAAVVASRFPLSVPGSITLASVLYEQLLVDLHSLEDGLRHARNRLTAATAHFDWASITYYARPEDDPPDGAADSRPLIVRPYRGLLSFYEEHQRFLFGRTAEIDRIEQALVALKKNHRPRFLLVTGASGTGKSSTVLAGVVPRLLAPPWSLRYAYLRPGRDPETALRRALLELGSDAGPRLLCVDQFEEIFTHVSDESVRQRFVQTLWSLASAPETSDGSLFHVVVTLRVDWIGRCGEIALDLGPGEGERGAHLDVVAFAEAHRVFITQLGQAQLEAVIEEPARLVGLRLEAGLSTRMITEVAGQPGALPLVQDTLDLLWQKRSGRVLTQAAYDQLGGVSGALQGRAERIISELSEATQRTARQLLESLVHLGQDESQITRRRRRKKELVPADPAEQERFDHALSQLTAARLLVCQEGGSGPRPSQASPQHGKPELLLPPLPEAVLRRLAPLSELLPEPFPESPELAERPRVAQIPELPEVDQEIEVAHEALLRRWPRLGEWLREDRKMLIALEELRDWVVQWQKHGVLLTGSQLGYAEQLAERYRHALSPDALRLIQQSRGAIDQQQRTARRRRIIAFAALIATTLILSAQGLAGHYERNRANFEREQAQAAKKLAEQHSANSQHEALKTRDTLRISIARSFGQDPTTAAWLLRELEEDDFRNGMPSYVSIAGSFVHQRAAVIEEQHIDERSFTVAAFRPDGELLAGASGERVSVVALRGSAPPLALLGHTERVTCLAWSPSGRLLISGSLDRTARIVAVSADGKSGIVRAILPGHGGAVRAVAFSADGRLVLTAGDDRKVRLWTPEGTAVAELPVAADALTEVAMSAEQRLILAVTRAGQVVGWRLEKGWKPLPLPTELPPVRRLAFGPLPGQVAAVSRATPPELLLWDRERRTVQRRPTGHLGEVRSIAFRADGQQLVTASHDGTARVFAQDGQGVPIQLSAHRGSVLDARFGRGGSKILTIGSDQMLRVWTLEVSDAPIVLTGHRAGLTSAVFSADGAHVVTASRDGSVRIHDAEGRHGRELFRAAAPILSAELSSDGRSVVAAVADGSVLILEVAAQKPPRRLLALTAGVRSAAFSPDGRLVLIAGADGALRIVASDGQSEPIVVHSHSEAVHQASFSADGRSILSASSDGTARIQSWPLPPSPVDPEDDLAHRGLGVDLNGHLGAVNAAAFSRDGLRVITASDDRTARLFRTNGELLSVFGPHEGSVRAAAFRPHGPWVATAADDGLVRIFGEFRLPMTLAGHLGPVSSVRWSPDGQRLISAAADGTAWIWRPELDPSAIRRRLWELSPICPAPAYRLMVPELRRNEVWRHHDACLKMIQCLHGERRPYAECLLSFRKLQHAGD